MSIGTIFSTYVEQLVAGGAGLGCYENQSVFIDDSCPGDTLLARVYEEHRGWARAKVLELTAPSPYRVTPFCPFYQTCGGCSLQHIAYETQLAEKERILRVAFTRIGGISALPEITVRASPAFEYRNRVQFHYIREGSGKTALGFKARNSGTLVSVSDCPVADPLIRRALADKCLTPPPEKDRFSVYARGDILLSEGGKSRGPVPILDRYVLMDAGAFFQSNALMLEVLIQDLLGVSAGLDTSLNAADIYCGVGTFAAFLPFPCMDLVEQDKVAISLARENMRIKGTQGQSLFRYFAQSADEWARTSAFDYGFVVLDPPRQGLSPFLRQRLSCAGLPVLAYVSCDPATLARDTKELLAGGYQLRSLTLYDFYPQTPHIESLAIFTHTGGRQ
ncbi:MAG: class I SAM-dependent RNA methyltransferase [Treponema sp.]|jgi:23S rRNA (uracil1939-C5)-methyltransferase|nr:class I SAM-dependent RNA methyltransferase [Treponema sp.]